MEALPGSVEWFIETLGRCGFTKTGEEHGSAFGDRLLTFERSPVEVRLIRDRGQWAADIRGEGWAEDERVPFPIFEGKLTD
jgi:hypothetical protein